MRYAGALLRAVLDLSGAKFGLEFQCKVVDLASIDILELNRVQIVASSDRFDHGNAQKIQDRKRSLLEPIDIHSLYSIATRDETVDQAHLEEILTLIDRKLPAHLRGDYLKLRSNSSLPKSRKANITEVIKRIIEGEYDEEG